MKDEQQPGRPAPTAEWLRQAAVKDCSQGHWMGAEHIPSGGMALICRRCGHVGLTSSEAKRPSP